MDDTNITNEKNKKKDTKTEVQEAKKELEDSIDVAEANGGIGNEKRLLSINDSINSLLDSLNNSARSSEENLNSQGSLSILDQKGSIDFTTFMNNKEKELNQKSKGNKSNKNILGLEDDENVNPFFLLNPELLESSSSEESLPLIENLNVDSSSFEKENANVEKEEQKVKEKEKEKENKKPVIEEADISEITNSEIDLSSFKKSGSLI